MTDAKTETIGETIGSDAIRALALSAWLACGGGEAMAHSLIEASLAANACGRPGVGFAHYLDYLDSLIAGRIDGHAEPVIDQPLPAALRCDARGGTAHYGFALALDRLATAARGCGIALFTLKNGYTAGEMAHYVRLLAGRGLIGLAVANAHAMVAPAVGGRAVFGTNPLAFALPRPAPRAPLVIDQASSATAFLAIVRAAGERHAIPDGWAIDSDGAVTTDPQAAMLGALLPFGGGKGANIALMIEVLAAGLSGGNWSLDAGHFLQGNRCPGTGMTVIAIAPEIADADMIARVDAQLDRLATAGLHIPGARSVLDLPESIAIEQATLAAIRERAGLA
ncbi:MAG: Ldh family oxidoreductase [Sphingomonadales bacterium]|nr:Ldh family oxidoreductase [Sphingomonadales bacterium]